MGYNTHSKRSTYDTGLKSLPCHHPRSRRKLPRRLYRASIFIAVLFFVGFQFHTSTNLEPWTEKASFIYNASNQSASLRTSDANPVSVQDDDSGDSEGFLEKVEYGIIKFFMGKIIAAHQRRQKAAAAFMSQDTTSTTESGKRIQRVPLAKTIDNTSSGEPTDYEFLNNSAPNNSGVHKDFHTFESTNNVSSDSSLSPKTILLSTRFFGRRNWTGIFGNSTDFAAHQCPVSNCVFTNDLSKAGEADALIFHARDFRAKSIPRVRKSHQRYIWLYHEAPGMENAGLNQVPDGFFNWTYTYHRDSDLLLLYGGVQPLQGDEANVTRPGLLNPSGQTYQDYMSALGQVDTTLDNPANVSQEKIENGGRSNTSEVAQSPDQRKLIAWMVSHCNTWSGRELYVQDLMQYVDVDTYGKCGPLSCGKTHHDSYCYSNVLAPNYKFYLSFENTMCNDYITEKVWYPLHHGLVPVVYGGARYQDYLPPHSYIDATHLTPPQLAALLIKLGSNTKLYNKYHVWRDYWRVLVPPPMCELCQRLHFDHTPTTVKNPQSWWKDINNCTTRYSFEEYPRQDLRLIVTKVDAGVKLFRRMIASFL